MNTLLSFARNLHNLETRTLASTITKLAFSFFFFALFRYFVAHWKCRDSGRGRAPLDGLPVGDSVSHWKPVHKKKVAINLRIRHIMLSTKILPKLPLLMIHPESVALDTEDLG